MGISKKVSLIGAVHCQTMQNAVYCGCNKKCQTKVCICFRQSKQCTSRCHKISNNNCVNNTKVSSLQLPEMPAWGGSVDLNGIQIHVSNTCPVDTWIASLITAFICTNKKGS